MADNASSQLTSIKKKIANAGYKLTPQREMTLQIMAEHEHLSAEEIYMEVKSRNAGIGLATVYRTLEILTDLKVINKATFQDGLARYDLNRDDKKHQPHHLLCLKCGKIEEVKEDLLIDIEQTIAKRYQFDVQDHRLTFHGICRECQSNAEALE